MNFIRDIMLSEYYFHATTGEHYQFVFYDAGEGKDDDSEGEESKTIARSER